MIRIGVISDIHAGASASARLTGKQPVAGRTDLFDAFLNFVKKEQLKLNYILVPGDVTNTADPKEVEIAAQALLEIAKECDVKPENIFGIPGNHDVDWRVLNLSDPPRHSLRIAQRYDAFWRDPHPCQQIFTGDQGHLFSSPYCALWQRKDLVVVGVNSAQHDDPTHKPHYGLVSQEQLIWLDGALSAIRPTSKPKLLLIHHHPFSTSIPHRTDIDLSALQRADELLSVVAKHKIHLIIHGHKHFPRVRLEKAKGAHDVLVLGSGSFSVDIPSDYRDITSNQFHVLEVSPGATAADVLYGKVFSWAHTSNRGWRVSNAEEHGIEHCTPFGPRFREADAITRVGSIVEQLLNAGKNAIRWSDVVKEEPDYGFLREEFRTYVSEQVSKKYDLELLRQEDQGNSYPLLVKK